MSARDQLDLLAQYIMDSVPGEPSQSEGAGDTAVRLLKKYRVLLDAVNAYRLAHSAAEATGAHWLDYSGNTYNTYVKMLVAADTFDPQIRQSADRSDER